jgi:hypothetical protein
VILSAACCKSNCQSGAKSSRLRSRAELVCDCGLRKISNFRQMLTENQITDWHGQECAWFINVIYGRPGTRKRPSLYKSNPSIQICIYIKAARSTSIHRQEVLDSHRIYVCSSAPVTARGTYSRSLLYFSSISFVLSLSQSVKIYEEVFLSSDNFPFVVQFCFTHLYKDNGDAIRGQISKIECIFYGMVVT